MAAPKAIIFAAGLGWRLGRGYPPKSLFEFAGKSLLQRHVELLRACGVDQIVVGTGYRHHLVEAELNRLEGSGIQTVFNPDFREGNIVTLWHLREHLCGGGEVILMDADVLYDGRMLARLVNSTHPNCLLLDENCEADDEPVKIWVREERIVEFGKLLKTGVTFDYFGESVGFFRFDADGASALSRVMHDFISRGERDALYEEAIRELMLSGELSLGIENITGLPWTEIDFHADLERARDEVLPLLCD